MRRAIVSDIHGNLPAWMAVLEDIKNQRIDQVFCLGDIIGYGPWPIECLRLIIELVLKGGFSLTGNHEFACLYEPVAFGDTAEEAILWTRDQIERAKDSQDLWEFISELPARKVVDRLQFVHGSPRNKPKAATNEYVRWEDIDNPRKMAGIYASIEGTAFNGHTHCGGVFAWKDDPEKCEFTPSARIDETDGLKLAEGTKYLINAGSVGQPRDSDTRACYLIWEEGQIWYRRVSYDVRATHDAILKIPALGEHSAFRLLRGH